MVLYDKSMTIRAAPSRIRARKPALRAGNFLASALLKTALKHTPVHIFAYQGT